MNELISINPEIKVKDHINLWRKIKILLFLIFLALLLSLANNGILLIALGIVILLNDDNATSYFKKVINKE